MDVCIDIVRALLSRLVEVLLWIDWLEASGTGSALKGATGRT